MKRWFSLRWLALSLLASLISLPLSRVPVAEALDSSTLPLPLEWIRKKAVTLPNSDAADVYYPRTPSPREFVDAFPVVAALQGASVGKIHYERFGRYLARHGFVVVIPNHRRSLAPPPAPRVLFSSRTVITHVLSQMRTEDANPRSPLYRIVDTNTLGLAGHSVGGVVGLFASAVDACVGPPIPPFCDDRYERPRALRAAAFYGTDLVQNGFSLNFNTTGVATALLQGTLDGLSPPRDARLTYRTLEQPRALITIDGANHYGISDKNNPPGAIPDLTPPTLDQQEATALVARWTGLWLRAQLKNDRIARVWLYEIGGSRDGVVTVRTD